jgi:uncharacterized membrane protein YraQ (UPF0718 family)
MTFITDLMLTALSKVWLTFSHNWPLLLISAIIATAMKLYVDQRKVGAFLKRHQGAGVIGATAVAVTTPLCSCGTTAIVLGMMASMLSWAPIVAFMVSSPLSSPEELFYSASLFGWPFAITFFVASFLLGLLGGVVAYFAEKQGWLVNQTRFQATDSPVVDSQPAMAGGQAAAPGLREFGAEFYRMGSKLLLMFTAFAFIGYILNGLIPANWVVSLFGNGHVYGVPLAATLGVPLYINTEASLPLVRSFLDLGMSPGATMAFMITGAGTSIGAIMGALTIARWRIIGIVVGTLWLGAVVVGYAYNALLALGIL